MEPAASRLSDLPPGKTDARSLFLIRVGEITLKGENRPYFESKLRRNIRRGLAGIECTISGGDGRFLVQVPAGAEAVTAERLGKVFGIVGFSEARRVEKDLAAVETAALEIVGELDGEALSQSFKVEARRTDKSFSYHSYDIARMIGAAIQRGFPTLRVDVHRPDWRLNVEIRDRAYLYIERARGIGGLPVGTAGRGMLLLSGGIDSPVAGYMMAKRGVKLDAVYFHTYPYTSDDAKRKVESLTKILSPYLGGVTLFVVPFTECQMRISERASRDEVTLLMRACMMRIAEILAERRGCECLVTGESLSQVASQTMESIHFTGGTVGLPVFRPLVGMDKEEIITRARAIRTFETSILPYDDCCTVFSPRHPLIRPKLEHMQASLAALAIDELLAQAAGSAERLTPAP